MFLQSWVEISSLVLKKRSKTLKESYLNKERTNARQRQIRSAYVIFNRSCELKINVTWKCDIYEFLLVL